MKEEKEKEEMKRKRINKEEEEKKGGGGGVRGEGGGGERIFHPLDHSPVGYNCCSFFLVSHMGAWPQALGPSSIAFLGTLTVSWIGSAAARTQTGTYLG